ncbi:MAG TPA: hypothetical protein VIT22_13845 [Pseudoxanthomonas sp.]
MGSAAKPYAQKDVILDIDHELDYWRGHYMHSAFHRTPRPFEDYLFTLKFGYDMYLLNHGCDLEALLPVMRDRYQATAIARDNLGWPLAEAVVRETWKRMRPDTNGRCDRTIRSAEASRAANWPQPQYRSA